MPDLRFSTVHEAMLDALPELRPCYQRLFDDWDNFDGAPPGQYNVFPDTFGKLVEILLTLPAETRGRRELLERAIAFGEAMLTSSDVEVRHLGIDALAETLDEHPAGPGAARDFGGPELQRWFVANSADDWVRPWPDEIIDLWGVREATAPLLPDVALPDIPGISNPRDDRALASLTEARQARDGVALLSTFGTTFLYVVCPARLIGSDDATLRQAAIDIAARIGGEHPDGEPGVRYRRIPKGERVWNMDVGVHRHTRVREAPWIADRLQRLRPAILDLLAGRIEQLPVAATTMIAPTGDAELEERLAVIRELFPDDPPP